MSERITSICLPGQFGCGIADHGKKTTPEMIEFIRRHAAQMKSDAEAILTATDDDFRVETYVGVYAKNRHEILQLGKSLQPHRAVVRRRIRTAMKNEKPAQEA